MNFQNILAIPSFFVKQRCIYFIKILKILKVFMRCAPLTGEIRDPKIKLNNFKVFRADRKNTMETMYFQDFLTTDSVGISVKLNNLIGYYTTPGLVLASKSTRKCVLIQYTFSCAVLLHIGSAHHPPTSPSKSQ